MELVNKTLSSMEQGLKVFQEQVLTKPGQYKIPMASNDTFLYFPICDKDIDLKKVINCIRGASSWDAELQDLVRQVDIIVNSKKVEWERKMKAFEAQMDIQHQELARAQSKLDQKGQEVELLCQKLENLEKTNCEMAQNYETQLCALKSQKQTQSYQFQISNKKQNHEEMVKYGQPEREKDGLIVEKLRAAVNEMIISRDRIEEGNLKLHEDLKMFQNQCQIRNPFYREEPSHCSEQERIRTEISDLTEELHQKEITIATIMEKASLLERRLKTELQIKDKLLTKQQGIDLSNKKHGDFTASVHRPEHENARLQNSLVKLQNCTETSMLGGMEKHGETEYSDQTHSKMQKQEERTSQNEDERHVKPQQTAAFTASRYHRNCSPTSHGQGDIIGSKSDQALSYHKLDRGHAKEPDDKSPLPPTEYPLCFGGLFPDKGRMGTSLSHAYDAGEIQLSSSPEISFLATTEKFLQEEEKHTKEFEERLNSHLEELQRLSENTLKKYTRLQQSQHT
ncbi:UNVERIFIED_CONTAM: hypothetical protein H355_006157 [Colinus virginianus]|nr:hypothetical protein H355_006157 [Colinus virginianus]